MLGSEHYSVIVIPKDRAKVRRWQISRRRILSILCVCGCFSLIVGLTIFGFFYYRQEYRKTADLRTRGERYEEERLKLLSRLEELEEAVGKTEKLAYKLETVAGLSSQPLKSGMQLASLDFTNLSQKAQVLDETSLQVINLKAVDLQEQAQDVSKRLDQVFQIKKDPTYFWSSIPTIWPVNGWITSDFGMRRSPMSGSRELHSGVDIAAPYGVDIVTPGDGVVTYAGRHGGYGGSVIIDHGYGFATVYGHASKVLVKEGDVVKRGMTIAKVGSTGRSTGPHLHYEVLLDGAPADPKKYILNSDPM